MKILLKEIRLMMGLSLRQLEALTGISRSSLSRFENNKVSPSMDEMELLAEGLNVKITDLYATKKNKS